MRTIIILLLFVQSAKAQQQPVDSLIKEIPAVKDDTAKARLYKMIAEEYCTFDPKQAMQYAETGLQHVNTMRWNKGIAVFNTLIGTLYSDQGKYDTAIDRYNKAYALHLAGKDDYNAAIEASEILFGKGTAEALAKIDEATFVRIKDLDFKDGIIEVKVLSRLLKTASPFDRGFIGVAYRISADNSKFDCIYIRPTNGRADEQVRRNHAIQYFSFPDFKFNRLRKEKPEMYESYADMGLNEWIKIKIVVKDKYTKLFLNDNKQPSLVVNESLGENISGALGLFVDVGTEGYFKNLKVTKYKD